MKKYHIKYGVLFFLCFSVFSIRADIHVVTLPNGQHERIFVEERDGYLLTEGDMMISRDESDVPGAVVVEKLGGKRWQTTSIPYVISNNLPQAGRDNIAKAMKEISHYTPVTFKKRDKENPEKNYVAFIPSKSTVCSSFVGRKGGRQQIILAPRCTKGSTMHEILHALGIWHEQSRGDRDSYIKVAWQNIKEEKKYNFNKHIKDGVDIADYDYASIMHYGPKAFSKNGEDTIIPLDEGKKIGQRSRLSPKDINAVAYLFSK
jgi:hypothetical protein